MGIFGNIWRGIKKNLFRPIGRFVSNGISWSIRATEDSVKALRKAILGIPLVGSALSKAIDFVVNIEFIQGVSIKQMASMVRINAEKIRNICDIITGDSSASTPKQILQIGELAEKIPTISASVPIHPSTIKKQAKFLNNASKNIKKYLKHKRSRD